MRAAAVLTMAAGLVMSGSALSVAGHGAGDVASYTACARSDGNGSPVHLAVGDAPARPCQNGFVTIHLSGGDITAVRAGTGLAGGGTNGPATLGLEPGYALPQQCTVGQVAERTASGWGCGADADSTYDGGDFALSDQSCQSGMLVSGVDAAGRVTCTGAAPTAPKATRGVREQTRLLPPQPTAGAALWTPVVEMSIGSGPHLVNAAVELYNTATAAGQDNSRRVTCRIGDDSSGQYFTTVPGDHARLTLPLLTIVTPPAPQTLTLSCRMLDGDPDVSHVRVDRAQMTALEVSGG